MIGFRSVHAFKSIVPVLVRDPQWREVQYSNRLSKPFLFSASTCESSLTSLTFLRLNGINRKSDILTNLHN
jgi:hypothetical protein